MLDSALPFERRHENRIVSYDKLVNSDKKAELFDVKNLKRRSYFIQQIDYLTYRFLEIEDYERCAVLSTIKATY